MPESITYFYLTLMKIPQFISLIVFTSLFFPTSSSGSEISVMYYNICNYFVEDDHLKPEKSEDGKRAIQEMIKAANPDILLVSELGRTHSQNDLAKKLSEAGLEYPYFKVVNSSDRTRHLAIYAKFTPKKFIAMEDVKYKIKPKKKGSPPVKYNVLRGFLRVNFTFENNYSLDIVTCHLKSRLFHRRFNQTDIRRYEARQLRYLANEIFSENPKSNLLVFGDMNDQFNSEPIRTIRGDKKKLGERLFDLRPLDQMGLSWTHWWHREDTYTRIDYVLASAALLPEINFEKSVIHHIPKYWMYASDHRPLLIHVNTGDEKLWPPEKITTQFPNGIRQK